jgi:hypothetical protein
MAKDINDPISVTEYIQKLDPEFGQLIEAIRQLILSADKSVGEQINPKYALAILLRPVIASKSVTTLLFSTSP